MADTDKATSSVFEIIAKIAKCEQGGLTRETRIAEDLGIKSVGRIELAALLEDKLGISIGNFEIRKPKTIGEVIDLVKSK